MIHNDDDDKDDITGSGGETGEGGRGGKSGTVGFRYQDAMSGGRRDDMLSPSEVQRLLAVHRELHKTRVDKQKVTRHDRQALKEGRAHAASGGYRAGYGGSSPYKKHWISEKAQFSGIDRQVTSLPSEHQAETNEENRNELENRYELRLQYQNAPTFTFNPKPRPY